VIKPINRTITRPRRPRKIPFTQTRSAINTSSQHQQQDEDRQRGARQKCVLLPPLCQRSRHHEPRACSGLWHRQ
jgi:hypothetical protein